MGGLVDSRIGFMTDTFHWRGKCETLRIKLKMWVR